MYGSHQKEREAMATVAPATRAEAPLRILKETAVPDSRAYGVVIGDLPTARSDHSTHLWVVAVHSEPTFMDIAAVLSVVSVVLVVSVVAGVVAAGVSAARTMGA